MLSLGVSHVDVEVVRATILFQLHDFLAIDSTVACTLS